MDWVDREPQGFVRNFANFARLPFEQFSAENS